MANYILQNKYNLERRHYLLLANTANHWFNTTPSRINEFKARYGDNFCIVLYRSGPDDDAYILPYSAVKSIFIEANIARSGKIRWYGDIRNGVLRLRDTTVSEDVSKFYNAFSLLSSR